MGNDLSKAAETASHFWQKPGITRIGQVLRPDRRYFVGNFYRGSKSIITEDELQACRVILRAYRRYKSGKKGS